MHIEIDTINHCTQRYDTVGDWFYEPERATMRIKVSSLPDERYEFLVALHELIEQKLCEHDGVSEETVSAYDIAHPESDDPGSEPDAPYRAQHEFATAIEMLVAQRLGVDWKAYDDAVRAL